MAFVIQNKNLATHLDAPDVCLEPTHIGEDNVLVKSGGRGEQAASMRQRLGWHYRFLDLSNIADSNRMAASWMGHLRAASAVRAASTCPIVPLA